jgi:hypothetical protein
MRPTLLPLAFALLVAGQAGCYLPLGSKVDSEREIGRRTDQATNTKTAIVHRVVRQHIVSPLETLSDEKPGHNYIIWHRYYLVRGAEEQRLEFLEVGFRGFIDAKKRVEEIEQRVLPVAGTTSWIAVREVKMHRPYVDLEITVFDEELSHRVTLLEGIHWQRPASSRAHPLGLNYIDSLEFSPGNRQILFATDEGKQVLDPLTLTVTKL